MLLEFEASDSNLRVNPPLTPVVPQGSSGAEAGSHPRGGTRGTCTRSGSGRGPKYVPEWTDPTDKMSCNFFGTL